MKKNLIEEGKRMGVNEIIRQNNLKPQVWSNAIILLKCKKIREFPRKKIQEFQKLVMAEQCYYQKVLYVVVKSQDLSRNKNQVDY